MIRARHREELLAGALGLLALLVALALAGAVHRRTTADGRALAAARQLERGDPTATLLVVDEDLGRGARDLGRILFPFRPLAAIGDGGPALQLDSFPFATAVLVGAVDPTRLGLPGAPAGTGEPRSFALGDPQRLLLGLVDYGRVAVVDAQGARPCRRAHHSGGVSCGHESWFYVGPVVEQLDGAARFCLWTHPPLEGARLRVGLRRLDGRPTDERLQIRLGFLDQVRGEQPRPPVELRLQRGEQTLQQTACDNRSGGCALAIAAAELGDPTPLDLELVTPDNRRQLICLSGGLVGGEVSP